MSVVWRAGGPARSTPHQSSDMALALTDRVHGRELAESLQLAIEYDPQPPFDAGSVDKAPDHVRELTLSVEDAIDRGAAAA